MPRELRVRNFEDIRAELNRLAQGPVETTGRWSYFQILSHLAKAVEGSMLGTRRPMPFWKKYILGPFLYRLFVLRGSIPGGIKGRPMERTEGDESQALAQLRAALEAFEKFNGPFSDHPILGPLSKKQWGNFHPLHFANHIRWAQSTKG